MTPADERTVLLMVLFVAAMLAFEVVWPWR